MFILSVKLFVFVFEEVITYILKYSHVFNPANCWLCIAFVNFTTLVHISFCHFFAQRGVFKAMIMNGIETKCLHYPASRSALQLHSGRFPHFSFSPVICSGRCSHLEHSLPRINQVLDDFHGHHFIYGPFLLSLPNVVVERPYHHLFMKSSTEKEALVTWRALVAKSTQRSCSRSSTSEKRY